MRTTYAVILCFLLLLVSACAPKVNDPADVQAIKKSMGDFEKAVNAGDAGAIAALMTDKTVWADANVPVVIGAEAIRSQWQPFFGQYSFEFRGPVEDVRVTGEVAVARGPWTMKTTAKAPGEAVFSDGGTWMVVFARQSDASWKWDWLVANSNQLLPGTTTDGAEEKALIQIEQDSANALLKSDVAAIDRFLAKEWTNNTDGQVMSKSQMLAEFKSGAYKIESMQLSDLSPHVFGDVAVVTATAVMKGRYKGSDIPSPQRGVDFFVKRDGQWQIVSTQAITIK